MNYRALSGAMVLQSDECSDKYDEEPAAPVGVGRLFFYIDISGYFNVLIYELRSLPYMFHIMTDDADDSGTPTVQSLDLTISLTP